jgi:hypothetical protein
MTSQSRPASTQPMRAVLTNALAYFHIHESALTQMHIHSLVFANQSALPSRCKGRLPGRLDSQCFVRFVPLKLVVVRIGIFYILYRSNSMGLPIRSSSHYEQEVVSSGGIFFSVCPTKFHLFSRLSTIKHCLSRCVLLPFTLFLVSYAFILFLWSSSQ